MMTSNAIRSLLKISLFASILLILGALTYQIALTQVAPPGNFPQTGHTITGEFLTFYQQVPNPELVYGYPITEQMTSKEGLIVQYFQKVRFELHPEQPTGQQVQLTPLGRLMYKPGTPFSISKNPATCRTFDSGFDVCYSFLEFFDQQGGLPQFGLPISEVEEREGRLVQYFEYARLEWHPDSVEAGLSQEVQLSYLGRQYFDQFGEEASLLWPLEGSFGQDVVSVRVHAFPVQAVVSPGESQVVYVIVQDQNLNPIPAMNVTLQMTYPGGATTTLPLPLTNEFGYTSGQVPFAPQDGIGIVEIEVSALNAAFEAKTRTSFRISP
ncbi:MAG: hypothetical protein HUU38_28670 [Anaerolineales bacterium]|nr:hypothetical protein [Anaerolineales bacterium]